MGSNGNSHSLLLGRQNGAVTLEDDLTVSDKAKHSLTTGSSNHTPSSIPNWSESMYLDKSLQMNVYRHFMQPRCALKKRMVSKLWHIHTIEYYSAVKRNELSSHEMTHRKFKCIGQSERNQAGKAIYYMIPVIWHSGKGKYVETVQRWVVQVGRRASKVDYGGF